MSDLIIEDDSSVITSDLEKLLEEDSFENSLKEDYPPIGVFDDAQKNAFKDEQSKSEEIVESSRQLLDSLDDGVVVLDLDGKIISYNKTAESLTGWKESDLNGKLIEHCFALISKNQGEEDFSLNYIDRLVSRLNSSNLVSKHMNGGIFSASASQIKDEMGKPLEVLLIFKKLEQSKKASNENLYKYKHENFITIMKDILHDINNYFTPILGNLSLVKMNTDPNDKNYEWLKNCELSCMKAIGYLKKLELISESGEIKKELASIHEVVKSSVDLIISGTKIECEYDFDENLKPVEVDKNKLVRALYNVIKAFREETQNGGTLKVCIENYTNPKNNLMPLDKEEYIKILIENSDKVCIERKQMGNGNSDSQHETNALGLTIAYNIIKEHGGYLDISYCEIEGIKAEIYIPALNEEVLFLDSEEVNYVDSSENTNKMGEKTRVLVMDDNEFVRDSLGEMLSQLGVDFDMAGDSDEAVRIYSKANNSSSRGFDIAILDLTMPGGMGIHAMVRVIKAIDPTVKVIVTTGSTDHPIINSFRKYGFDGFIKKPFEISELQTVISNVLE